MKKHWIARSVLGNDRVVLDSRLNSFIFFILSSGNILFAAISPFFSD
jgi:hypothetical protein